jgi:3'-phosphoadenosine 5'-phosphosulfate sulfotransferase
MKVSKKTKTIRVSELIEKIKLSKSEKKLNVALVDQNFLKRNEEQFISTSNQQFFLLKSKIGTVQKRAIISVYINGLKTALYEIRTSATDSSKSELYFTDYNFEEGEEVTIVY